MSHPCTQPHAASSPRTAPRIVLSGVGKTYGSSAPALEGIDLTVRTQEFVSLVGPSGCGKSTLLRMMAGLTTPTVGRVSTGTPDIGFVFQEPTLMPWASVSDNVHLPLRLHGVSKAAARPRIAEALARVGLGDVPDALPRELSGGMKMRVSIARALVTQPTLLLMDEPFAALDDLTRHKLNDDLLALWAAQRWTVVFVTHSIYEAVYLSSRVAVMAARPGRLVADLAIDAPYPRDAGFRLTPAYAAHCGAVSAALERAGATDD